MKRINNIKIYEDLDNNTLIKHICKKYHILYEDILDWHIIKKSIDARNKDNIHYLYNIAISFKSEKKYSKFDDYKKFELPNINIKNNNLERPIIVGAGPAGLFAALTFIKNGISINKNEIKRNKGACFLWQQNMEICQSTVKIFFRLSRNGYIPTMIFL